MLSQAAKFDWYSSTVQASDPQESGLVAALQQAWDLTDWVPAKNRNGYTYGGAIVRGSKTLAHLCWGGNSGISVTTTSSDSPVLVQALRKFSEDKGIGHLPTRVDACCDWVESGLFDSLAAHLMQYAIENRLAINQQGDWERGEARTLYIGSKDSPVRLVLYEKGYEQGGDAPRDWVRLEVRVKPKKAHKAAVSAWDAATCFCAGWVPDALKVLDWEGLQKKAVGTVWRQEDAERSRAALLRQYGRVMTLWAEEEGGWSQLGETIGKALQPA
jgi:hypothetical protein